MESEVGVAPRSKGSNCRTFVKIYLVYVSGYIHFGQVGNTRTADARPAISDI
jgi:hypothetical protein